MTKIPFISEASRGLSLAVRDNFYQDLTELFLIRIFSLLGDLKENGKNMVDATISTGKYFSYFPDSEPMVDHPVSSF